MNTGKLDASVARIYKDEAEKEAEAFEADPNGDHPLAQEFKRSEINFQELLETKISTKGQLMSDFKKRSEESKTLIISLRKAVGELLGRRDAVIERAIAMETTAKERADASAARIAELENDVARSREAMDANAKEIAELQQKYAAIEKQLGECDAAKASALARAYQLDTDLSSEKLARESTKAMLDVRDQELADCQKTLEEARRKTETDQLSYDKEMNDLRTQLGQEMVISHENKTKLSALTEQFQELKTKFAVSEEMCKAARSQVERVEGEAKEKMEVVERLEKDKEAANLKMMEMQTRMDCKEQQHAQVVTTMSMSQDMHTQRLKEVELQRDSALEDLKAAKAENEEVQAQLYQAKQDQQAVAIELRMSEAQLEQASKSLEEKASEAEGIKSQLAQVVAARAEVAEAHAVLQAEFAIFRQQANMPKQIEEQIERLCRQQTENKRLEQTMNATEADLAAERALVQRLQEQLIEANKKLVVAETARRKCFNELQELKGNIRVFCRVRLASRRASRDEGVCPITMDSDTGGCFLPYNGVSNDFKFDQCFGQDSTQEMVFDEVKNFVQSALDGYNVSLLAYGQTGAGKTHTMLGGADEHRGIIPRSIEQILASVEQASANGWEYQLEASFLEIYNETVRDLLCPPGDLEGKKFNIVQGDNGMMAVAELTTVPVATHDDITRLMRTAEKHKTVKGTDMNARSSRSHTVFQLRIKATRQLAGGAPRQQLHGSLNLVDLAGSERLDKSGATGDRLKETQAINKSLSALGDVFTAISKRQAHVPYRNSLLTRLLQSCLSGDGKALVLFALSPSESSAHESLCTLRFSSLISQCELGKATRHIAASSDAEGAAAKRPCTAPGGGTATAKRSRLGGAA